MWRGAWRLILDPRPSDYSNNIIRQILAVHGDRMEARRPAAAPLARAPPRLAQPQHAPLATRRRRPRTPPRWPCRAFSSTGTACTGPAHPRSRAWSGRSSVQSCGPGQGRQGHTRGTPERVHDQPGDPRPTTLATSSKVGPLPVLVLSLEVEQEPACRDGAMSPVAE